MPVETGRLESTWTIAGGYRLFARVSDEAAPGWRPPIVLVHGLSVSSRYMIPTAEHLAPYYRVYAPDLPGFGRSAKPAHVLNIGELADALVAYMDVVGLEAVPMVANSLGCQIVVDLALRYPGRVTHAFLLGPTMDRYARSVPQQAWRLLRDSLREPFPQQLIVLSDYLRAGPRRSLCTLRYGLADRIEEKLPRVRVPVVVARGARDPIVSERWAEELTSLLSTARLVVFPGAAHTVNYSYPGELAQAIRAFLDERPRPFPGRAAATSGATGVRT